MAETVTSSDILGTINVVTLAILIIALILYQPLLPQWVYFLLALFILLGFLQIMMTLQGKDKFYFLYSLNLGILFLILYFYFVR